MLNVSDTNWANAVDFTQFCLFDQYIYTGSNRIFNLHYKDKVFCDCNGNLYKVVGKTPPTETWRNLLRFLPNTYRVTLELMPLNQTMQLEEFRQFVLDRLNSLENADFINDWILKTKNAKTYREILGEYAL